MAGIDPWRRDEAEAIPERLPIVRMSCFVPAELIQRHTPRLPEGSGHRRRHRKTLRKHSSHRCQATAYPLHLPQMGCDYAAGAGLLVLQGPFCFLGVSDHGNTFNPTPCLLPPLSR